ncbi:hypothetical protein CH63R_14233 [Colletotrichum higginsianum IMI 349063]|uniref:Uncharacterized protein n=1 Tax=Colletotrichum higginsianum (strain IMI 349063) TaxID=759273 RepID=A0A1B7XTB6_COLHI|nr:hypothetical protein CH63R_14233 [Colletotrichum higginsianum IMI 349063]OBR03007.1 hypothetical protein CH63R_14233 [Colletotrichum higginsianum IMI 349063]
MFLLWSSPGRSRLSFGPWRHEPMCFSGWCRLPLIYPMLDHHFKLRVTLDCIYASTALAAAGEPWVLRADVNVGSVNSTEKPGSPGNRPRLLTDPPPYQ